MTARPAPMLAGFDWSRILDWPARLARETPLIEKLLAGTPERSAVDVGCGTGEHARLLASLGFSPVVGIDPSEEMLGRAGAAPVAGVSFARGVAADVEALLGRKVGAAICLGNVLPSIPDHAELDASFAAIRRALVPGGLFLLQMLNYDRIHDRGIRHLPLTIRPDPAASDDASPAFLVFLRLLDPHPDGTVLFSPTLLRWRPGDEAPAVLDATQRVVHRGWRRAEIEQSLGKAGFVDLEIFGGLAGEPWSGESTDLVVRAKA